MGSLLPEELWIKILGYVSLEDRIKHVQFTSKEFYRLCFDPMLTKRIDFSSVVFVPDKVCRRVLHRTKSAVTNMSFRGCHWLPTKYFCSIPMTLSLRTLDLSGCYLHTTELHKILRNVPNLRNLAFSLKANSRIFDLDSQPDDCLHLSLDRLHIDCWARNKDLALQRRFRDLDRFEYSKLISRFLITYMLQWFGALACLSLSIELCDKLHELKDICVVKPCLGVRLNASAHTADFGCLWYFGKIEQSLELCKGLAKIGLHGSVAGGNVATDQRQYSLSETKFLSLPTILIPWFNHNVDVTCTGSSCPKSFPNLEFLRFEADIWEPNVLSCYDDVKSNLLLVCDYPRLKCLNIGRSEDRKQSFRHVAPKEFYTRISNLQYLEELNLRYLPIDFDHLLDALRKLKRIHALSITLNESLRSIFPAPTPRVVHGRRSSRFGINEVTFFETLVDVLPCLIKLEISQSSTFRDIHSAKVFEAIGDLLKLKVLSLCDLAFVDWHIFNNILKKCTNLSSLTISNCGKAGHCEYPRFLSNIAGSLHRLVEIRLQHDWLELSPALLNELARCEKIEKLVLRRSGSVAMTASQVLGQFEILMKSCRRLHTFAYIAPDVPSLTSQKIRQLQKRLKRSGRRVAIFCGAPDQDSPAMPMTVAKIVDFSKSVVAVQNAYEYLLANEVI